MNHLRQPCESCEVGTSVVIRTIDGHSYRLCFDCDQDAEQHLPVGSTIAKLVER